MFAGALTIGAIAACCIALDGLTLAHYDARGHLIVARRLTDSLTPGWRQLGALWLPLPHILNAIPVMWDWNYQTGFSAVAINVVAMAIGLGALADFIARRTGSTVAAIAGALVVQLNPGVLFLTGTPMTEPLLFAFGWLALNAADKRLDAPEHHAPLAHPGPWMAMAVLTRYEAWPIAAALTVIATLSRYSERATTFIRLAAWPTVAAAAFLLFGRLTLGRFFADADFFTADNPAAHQPAAVLIQIIRGYVDIAGWPVLLLTGAGAVALAVSAWRARCGRALLPFALFAAIALPFTAFLDGHPYRVRYMVALVAASGALIGAAIGAVPRRWRGPVALAALVLAVWARPPLSPNAPMTIEAQRETATRIDRGAVTAYLRDHYDGGAILASQNSLGHYMQELSAIRMPLRAFINAGNGDLWSAAVAHPERHARWVLIEEAAEGGDEIASISRRDPDYLSAFEPVAAGGGARLYRRRP